MDESKDTDRISSVVKQQSFKGHFMWYFLLVI